LDEDETLAIVTALALYCQNVFSSLSTISANVIDIQQRDTELGPEIAQRLQRTARTLVQTLACDTINNETFIGGRLHNLFEAVLRFGRFTTSNTGTFPTNCPHRRSDQR
jgi:hypothetical protein